MSKSVDDAVKRLRRQGYKPIEEADLTPEQRAFAEGYKQGWNACVEHHEQLTIKSVLAAERDDDDPPRLN